MFNTISKRCLLCLRLVSYGGFVVMVWLYQGRCRLAVCVPHSCSLLLLGSSVDMCWKRCVSVVACEKGTIHKCAYSAAGFVSAPFRAWVHCAPKGW